MIGIVLGLINKYGLFIVSYAYNSIFGPLVINHFLNTPVSEFSVVTLNELSVNRSIASVSHGDKAAELGGEILFYVLLPPIIFNAGYSIDQVNTLKTVLLTLFHQTKHTFFI